MAILLYFALSSQTMVRKRTSNWSINLILKERKMKKSLFMKVLALLFVGAGALAYSCSGDDIFEEEEDARSLAKRAMQIRGEDIGGTDSGVICKILKGEASGRSMDNLFSVELKWEEGNLTRERGPHLTVTDSPNGFLCRSLFADGRWQCSTGPMAYVSGTITYERAEIKRIMDAWGHVVRFDTIWHRGNSSYGIDIDSSKLIVEDDRWNPAS